jgi:hypothetical protein
MRPDGVIAMTQPPAGSGPEMPFDPVPVPADGYRPSSTPARALALTAAALGLLIYLLGFVGEVSVTSSFGGPLLVGGGLLAGVAVLPRVGRVLAAATVLVLTGTLLLVQLVIGIGAQPVLIVALAVAVLEAAAVFGALLLDSGVIGAGSGRSRGRSHPPAAQAGPAGVVRFGLPGYATGQRGPPDPGVARDDGWFAGPPAAAIGVPPAVTGIPPATTGPPAGVLPAGPGGPRHRASEPEPTPPEDAEQTRDPPPEP